MGKKVLIIDDSATALQFVKDTLSAHGYEVETSEDIWVAGIINQFQPDLVLMDVIINGLKTGHVAVTELKKTAKGKIVLYSSCAEDELQKLAQDCQADGYICKVEDADVFHANVQAALAS